MPNQPLPPELLAAHPILAEDPFAQHPSNGGSIGPPPARYSQGLHAQIIANIKAGNRGVTAAQMAGLPSTTFYSWLRMGKEGNPHLVQFVEDVDVAGGCAEGAAVKALEVFQDADAAKFWLERTRPEGFSKEVNAKVNALLSEFIGRLREGLPDAIYRMVLAIGSGQVLEEAPATFQLTKKPDVAEPE